MAKGDPTRRAAWYNGGYATGPAVPASDSVQELLGAVVVFGVCRDRIHELHSPGSRSDSERRTGEGHDTNPALQREHMAARALGVGGGAEIGEVRRGV